MENWIPKKSLKGESSISQDLQGIKKDFPQVNIVVAGIVVYNPDHNRLAQFINHLKKQVACIIIYDNSTEKESNFDFSKKVVYISHHRNDGVAHVLNEIFKKAKALGYKWLLTMDQDTIVPDDMVETFANFFNEEKRWDYLSSSNRQEKIIS